MYLRHTLLGVVILLPALSVNALPLSSSRRAPSPLGKEINLSLETNLVRGSRTLSSTFKLVRVDEPTDDDAVQVYDVVDFEVLSKDEPPVVAKTMKDTTQKIPAHLDLGNQLVAYGPASDTKQFWLLHIRPSTPRMLDDVPEYSLTLNWKEQPDSDTWKTSRDIKLPAPRVDGEGNTGSYTSTNVDWTGKTGEKMKVDVISKRDGSEMSEEEKEKFLQGGELLAYGYEAATEFYIKRWWLVKKAQTGDDKPLKGATS